MTIIEGKFPSGRKLPAVSVLLLNEVFFLDMAKNVMLKWI